MAGPKWFTQRRTVSWDTTIPRSAREVLDIPEAQREPDIQPDRVLDDFRRKAISAVADLGHHEWLRLQVSAGKPGT
jgi:hypothetical protein